MKRLIFILMTTLFYSGLLAQCPQGDITLDTQQEIDNFAINYPGCTQITGDLNIGPFVLGSNNSYSITNLGGLSQLITIGGDLVVRNNRNLVDLTGLNNLVSIGETLDIDRNPGLQNLNGFDSLNSVKNIVIQYNYNSIKSLEGLNNLTNILGSLIVKYNYEISDLSALNQLNTVGGNMSLSNTDSLIILNGFANLVTIGGSLSIRDNSELIDISVLENLNSIGDLVIKDNPILALCNVGGICDYLSNGGNSTVENNGNCCSEVMDLLDSCSESADCCAIGGITITTQSQIDNFAATYPGCTNISGDLIIEDDGTDSIISLLGLINLTSIEGELKIINNPSLNSLVGLENIDYNSIINLQIYNNATLSFCNILNICNYIGFSDATISDNASGCNTAIEIVASCAPRDGFIDTDFGTNGIMDIAGHNVNCILTQPDDKIVVFGSSVLRLNPDGTLDTSFGTSGVTSVGGFEGVLQPDGKIVVISTSQLARLNADGTLDTTFGTGGTRPLIAPAKSIALSPDGKIVTSDTELVRYNTDGSVDTSFGNNGIVSIEVQAYHYGDYPGAPQVLKTYYPSCHVIVKSDGKIIVAGDFYYQSRYNPEFIIYYNQRRSYIGYNADGTKDSNFNHWIQGWNQGDVFNYVDDLVLLPDDEFVVLGSTDFELDGILCMNQYDGDGVSLGGNCSYTSLCEDSFYYGASWARATVADCGVFAFGEYGTIFGNTCNFLTRTDYDGTPFSAFGDNGGVPLPVDASFNNTADIALQSDGSIIVAGNSATGIALARLHNDEACTTTFPPPPPTNPCGGTPSTDSLTHIFDTDLFIDGIGFANNPVVTFTDPGTSANAVLSDISLELYFRLNDSSCENDIAIQITDPAGNTQALTAYTTCDGGTGLYYINLDVPSGNTTGSVADWVVEFDDTNDQNSDYEYSVRFARLNYVATTSGSVTTTNEVVEIADNDLFIDGIGFANNPSYTFTDPATPADATLSDISLELYFRLNGSSCENEIAIQITDPAGNTQALTAYTACDGGTGLYYVNLDVPSGNTTGNVADWTVQFDDTNDQNSDYEYSVRFGRLTYIATSITGGGTLVTVNEEVTDFADTDLFVDGVGFDNNGSYTFTDPATPADALLSDISLELYFRLDGSSCENEIALQITDPAGNTQPLTAYTTCDGGTDLYYINLDVPSGNTTGSVADWLVQFDDTNDQNAGYEYSVRFGRLTYKTTYDVCDEMMIVNNDDSSNQQINSPIKDNFNTSARQHNNTLKLYPVPASQYLNVEYFSEDINPTNIEIISNKGKMLVQKEAFSQKGINTLQLDIAQLPAGHYHIRVYNVDDVYIQSFIKISP